MLWNRRWRSVLRLECRVFDFRWCLWNFSLTQFCRPQYVRWVGSASNRNEYQEYFVEGTSGRCVGLTTLPHSCGDCLEVWEPQPPGTITACPGITLPFFVYHIRCSPTKINAHNSEFLTHIPDSTLKTKCVLHTGTYGKRPQPLFSVDWRAARGKIAISSIPNSQISDYLLKD